MPGGGPAPTVGMTHREVLEAALAAAHVCRAGRTTHCHRSPVPSRPSFPSAGARNTAINGSEVAGQPFLPGGAPGNRVGNRSGNPSGGGSPAWTTRTCSQPFPPSGDESPPPAAADGRFARWRDARAGARAVPHARRVHSRVPHWSAGRVQPSPRRPVVAPRRRAAGPAGRAPGDAAGPMEPGGPAEVRPPASSAGDGRGPAAPSSSSTSVALASARLAGPTVVGSAWPAVRVIDGVRDDLRSFRTASVLAALDFDQLDADWPAEGDGRTAADRVTALLVEAVGAGIIKQRDASGAVHDPCARPPDQGRRGGGALRPRHASPAPLPRRATPRPRRRGG